MERLTDKHYSGKCYYLKCSSDCPNDGFCDDCEKLFEAIDCLGEYEDKAEQKPMTNADRIRAMTDEELANFLANPCECSVDTTIDGHRECGNKLCIQYLLEWLQQPAEEDKHGE